MESDPLVHAWEMYWSHRLHGTTNDYKAFEDTVRPLLQQVEGERDALAAELAEVKARLKESEAENWALRQRVERYVKWFGDEDDPYDDCRVQLGGRCKCGDGKHGDLAARDAESTDA